MIVWCQEHDLSFDTDLNESCPECEEQTLLAQMVSELNELFDLLTEEEKR